MASQWFHQAAGKEVGPVSSAELRNLAQRGVVTRETLVKNAPDAAWVPAEHVRGLFPVSNATPLPVPPAEPIRPLEAESESTPRVADDRPTLRGPPIEEAHAVSPPRLSPQANPVPRALLLFAGIGAGTGTIALVLTTIVAVAVFGRTRIETRSGSEKRESREGELAVTASPRVVEATAKGVTTDTPPPKKANAVANEEEANRIKAEQQRTETLRRRILELRRERDLHNQIAGNVERQRQSALLRFAAMSEQGKAIAAAKMITDHELDGGGPGVLHLISPVLEVAYPDSELAKLATAAEKRAHLQIAGSAVMEGRASREHILEALLWADAGSEVAVKARGMLKNYARELGFAVFSKDYEVAAQKEHDAVSKVERAIEKAEKELGGG